MGLLLSFALLAAGQVASGPGRASAAAPAAPMTAGGFADGFDRVQTVMRETMPAMNREVRDAIVMYRADVATAHTAGRPPRGCIPDAGKGTIAFDEIARAFRALPEAERAMPVRQALFGYFDRHYPCPAAAAK